MTKPSIVQLAVGPMANFAYLVADDEAKFCAVVDPGWDASSIISSAEISGWRIDKVLLTHTHFDHVNALAQLAELADGGVYAHGEEAGSIDDGIPTTPTADGTVIEVGGVRVECLHTPGHTPGSQCFLVEGAILTGDTLFIDGCGRVDLPGSDPDMMLASLKQLAALDPSIIVYPGHDYGGKSATIGELMKSNPYLTQAMQM